MSLVKALTNTERENTFRNESVLLFISKEKALTNYSVHPLPVYLFIYFKQNGMFMTCQFVISSMSILNYEH